MFVYIYQYWLPMVKPHMWTLKLCLGILGNRKMHQNATYVHRCDHPTTKKGQDMFDLNVFYFDLKPWWSLWSSPEKSSPHHWSRGNKTPVSPSPLVATIHRTPSSQRSRCSCNPPWPIPNGTNAMMCVERYSKSSVMSICQWSMMVDDGWWWLMMVDDGQ